jgi:8-oxo-dGTP diphosphatase
MVRTRRRGTAIVDTPNGILVVSLGGRNFLLPGGGARRGESGQDAAIRELREETGLKAVDIAYLFDFTAAIRKGARGGSFRNAHKVFLVTATGTAEPGQEVRQVAYYDGSSPSLSYSAKTIIEKYHSIKGPPPKYVSAKCPNDGSPLDVKGTPPYVKCPYDGAILYRSLKGVYRLKG